MNQDPGRRSAYVFYTVRLRVRPARPDNAELIYALWSDPQVMTFVGFRRGLPTTHNKIRSQIERHASQPQKRLLIAELASDGQVIGQCKLGAPDGENICEPDVKLLPAFWRRGFGRELWKAMIDVLFRETDCLVVQGTPNVASIRMMESCGCVSARQRRTRIRQRHSDSRVWCRGRGRFDPPEPMRSFAEAVEHHVYRMTRQDWQ